MDHTTHMPTERTVAHFLGARNVKILESNRHPERCGPARRPGDSIYDNIPFSINDLMWTYALAGTGQLDSDDKKKLNTTWISLRNYHNNSYQCEYSMTEQELQDLELRMECLILPNGIQLTCRFILDDDDDSSMVDFVYSTIEACNGWAYGANIGMCRDDLRKNEAAIKDHPAHIRIRISEKKSWSQIGMNSAFVPLKQPTMVLANSADSKDVLHEFGHALGLQHEHQRCMKGLECNAGEARKHFHDPSSVESDVIERREQTKIDPFEYDPDSIMHYDFESKVSLILKAPRLPTPDAYNFITEKDQKLMAYLYPLPVGNNLGVMPTREWVGRRPRPARSHRQTTVLPHPWSSTPRVILGMRALEWTHIEPDISVQLMTTARAKRTFQLEAWGNKEGVSPSLSYLALDPHIWNVQTSSCRTYDKSVKSMNPNLTHDDVELHWLRENTTPDAKVITWFNVLKIPNTRDKFEIAVDHQMDLTPGAKQLALHYRCTSNATASTNWTVINPDALNVDGGNVTWTAADSDTEHYCAWKDGLFPFYHTKNPNVIIGINGLKYHYHADKHGDDEPVRFEVRVVKTTNDGFYWRLETCHPGCFEEVRFSWVVVPQPMLRFGYPKGKDRPTRYTKRKQEESKVRAVKEVRDLFLEHDLGIETEGLFKDCSMFEMSEHPIM